MNPDSVRNSIDLSKFKCLRCGACCRWKGIVRVSSTECDRIAEFLQMNISDFLEKYTVLAPDRQGLIFIDRPDGACIFFDDDKGCLIHPVKPHQCRTFPYDWDVPEDMRMLCAGQRALALGSHEALALGSHEAHGRPVASHA